MTVTVGSLWTTRRIFDRICEFRGCSEVMLGKLSLQTWKEQPQSAILKVGGESEDEMVGWEEVVGRVC